MSTSPKPFDGRSYDGRLLLQMLSHLPLADIYSAMRVCRPWRLTIVKDTALRQLMFTDQLPEETWPMREWYQMFFTSQPGLSQRTCYVEVALPEAFCHKSDCSPAVDAS